MEHTRKERQGRFLPLLWVLLAALAVLGCVPYQGRCAARPNSRPSASNQLFPSSPSGFQVSPLPPRLRHLPLRVLPPRASIPAVLRAIAPTEWLSKQGPRKLSPKKGLNRENEPMGLAMSEPIQDVSPLIGQDTAGHAGTGGTNGGPRRRPTAARSVTMGTEQPDGPDLISPASPALVLQTSPQQVRRGQDRRLGQDQTPNPQPRMAHSAPRIDLAIAAQSCWPRFDISANRHGATAMSAMAMVTASQPRHALPRLPCETGGFGWRPTLHTSTPWARNPGCSWMPCP